MELLDIYDRDRRKTGKTMVRGEWENQEGYHLIVHVCIFNSKGEMLIQKRHEKKKVWPGKWDFSVGGCATSGDSSQQAAQREMKEELGLDVDFSEIRPHLTLNFEHGFDDVYLIQMDVDLEKIHLQEEEVTKVKWADRKEVARMLESGEFVPYFKSLPEFYFDQYVQYGSVREEGGL